MRSSLTTFSVVGNIAKAKNGGYNIFIDGGRYYMYLSKYSLLFAKADDEQLHVCGKSIITKSGNLLLLCNNGHKFLVNRKDKTVSYINEPVKSYTTDYENNFGIVSIED